MAIMESYEQHFQQADNNPIGIEVINQWHMEDEPNSNLANSAMLFETLLRNTKNAVATGRDVSVLGSPSQELLTDMILDMPIGIRESTPAGQLLFQSLVDETGSDKTSMTEDLILFTRYIQSAVSPYTTMSNQERLVLSINLDSYIHGLQYTAQKLVNEVMDKRGRWGHEGGNIYDLHPEIYREFIDREYLRFMMSKQDGHDRPGLTRQVALRMLHEAEWLAAQEQEALLKLR